MPKHPSTNERKPNPSGDSPEPYQAIERSPDVADPRRSMILDRDHSRSLRSKLVLSLAFMLSVVVGIDEIVRQKVIIPEFARLERVAAFKDSNRVLSAINSEIEFLAETAGHDASQLEAAQVLARLVADPMHPIIDDASRVADIAAAVFDDTVPLNTGRVEWSAVTGPQVGWHWMKAPDDPTTEVFPRLHAGPSQGLAMSGGGITLSAQGKLYLFAAVPLGDGVSDGELSDGQRDPHGESQADDFKHRDFEQRNRVVEAPGLCYIVGRRFDQSVISDLEKRTCVPFSVATFEQPDTQTQQTSVCTESESVLLIHAPLTGIDGTAIAQLQVKLPRDVTLRSNRATAFARYLSLCGACVSLLLLLLMLQRLVIGRLETIREHTERIAESGILSDESTTPVLRDDGHDEIGQLARSFDRMRVRLSDAQRKLSDTSHAAGMSLVADTVIHNVGNVLTNVNSLIETASHRIDRLRIEPLDKLANRLREDEVDVAMWQATPDYLHRLSETLREDKHDLSGLLETLADNVQHIHQVIRDQRRYSGQPVKWIPVDVNGIIDEAVRCCRARLDQDNVKVAFDRSGEPTIWTDRSLLLQILINIIGNAGNATRGEMDDAPHLQITVSEHPQNIRIAVRDNGCGMDSATLSRVFDAHFTTRSSGSGLGLHFCAIAVKRIGGRIRAESDGPGCGANFTVELPTDQPHVDHPHADQGVPASELTAT